MVWTVSEQLHLPYLAAVCDKGACGLAQAPVADQQVSLRIQLWQLPAASVREATHEAQSNLAGQTVTFIDCPDQWPSKAVHLSLWRCQLVRTPTR